MGDTRAYYCPSSDSAPKVPWDGLYPPSTPRVMQAITTPNELKSLGEFNARSLSHGNYQAWYASKGWAADRYHNWWYAARTAWYTNDWADKYCAGGSVGHTPWVAVASNYMYRNAAYTNTYSSGGPDKAEPIYWVRPKIRAYPGSAIFKTQKLLGGRAIVSDDLTRTNAEQQNTLPGQGEWAHREGYNVLYGDWSARWYGDPQQRIMYIDCTGGNAGATYRTNVTVAQNALFCGIYNRGYRIKGYGGNATSGVEAWQMGWHLYDLASGIDAVDRWDPYYDRWAPDGPYIWPGWPDP